MSEPFEPARVRRLDLGRIGSADGGTWAVHGFVVMQGSSVVLVDTGIGGPDERLSEARAVNHSVVDALGEHGLTPADVQLVINTHLHIDHSGWNAVFRHAPFWVQRAELEWVRRERPWYSDWYDFAGARFELLDGDAEVAPGLRILATPGHTPGHQSVLVATADGEELLVGDAVWRRTTWEEGGTPAEPARDQAAWRRSVDRLRGLAPHRVHFCHDDAWLARRG